MVNPYSIPQGKALIAAAFVQYSVYAVLYSLQAARALKKGNSPRNNENYFD
jgi:hypothetical protein